MASLAVVAQQQIDDYSVLETLTGSEIAVGRAITVASLVTTAFNGSFTVYALPQYQYLGVSARTGEPIYDTNYPRANQVMYYNVQATDIGLIEVYAGQITYTLTCTWVTTGNVDDWLGGVAATPADTAFIATCADAANAFCFRRRQESGYFDSLTTVPSNDVKLGTIMYAGALYRQRGAVQDFAGFDQMQPAGSTVGLSGIVKQLLGIDRPQVA
jgi:hypothetical protein